MVLFLGWQEAWGQRYCGTELPEEMKSWLRQFAALPADAQPRTLYELPLQMHLVGRDDGKGLMMTDVLWQNLCDVNEQFAETGFRFFLYDYPHYIFNTQYYAHDFGTGAEMMFDHNVPKVINVYVTGDAAGTCGYFWSWPDAIAMSKGCFNLGNSTMAHELGHYFSLPHPFDNINGILEYVDGSNCSVGGDLFCDTRADILDYRWACPYTGSATDPKGDPYDPDSTLFMSYALDRCTHRFSAGQMQAMRNYLVSKRSYLLQTVAPVYAPIHEPVVLLSPAEEDTMVPNDFVEFRWTAVPNATFYHLQATRFASFFAPELLDVIVEGTSFTTWLKPGYNFQWRVKPLNASYFCAPYSTVGHFSTVQGTGLQSMPGEVALQLFPTLVAPKQSVRLRGLPLHQEAVRWQLFSTLGSTVTQGLAACVEGMATVEVPEVPSGSYLLSLDVNGRRRTFLVMVH